MLKLVLLVRQAWDTLFWFAVLVGMSGQLNALGVIKHFADAVGGRLVAANLGWPAVFGLLNAVYFGLHYMFASQTAHVGALYAAFLAMMLAAGVPLSAVSALEREECTPLLSALLRPIWASHSCMLFT